MQNQWKKNVLNRLIVLALILSSSSALAKNINPNCTYEPINIKKYGNPPFQNPPDIRAQNGRLDTTFNVQFTDPKTTSIAGCPVKLRTYNGQLVGSTLRV